MAEDQNNKVNISLARVGMAKDTHPSQLNETQYTHAFNANIENEGGNSLNITNEKSNILASTFKPGFVVIGFENDILSNDTFFFLVNPTTGVGEFGHIADNQNVSNLQDLTYQCNSECDSIRELAMPLEDFYKIDPLVPLQEYVTLLSDESALDTDTNICYTRTNPIYAEKKLGFNFDVNHPIKKIVIKNEKTGKKIYFTDNYNPPRNIDITNLADYYVQNVACLDDEITDCISFDELRIFKLFQIPTLKASSIELGGRLKMGAYEFLIAYADASGQTISPYYSITQPISIFDKNNKILEPKEIADITNFSIKLEVSGLDKRYTHYKVAVIQTANVDGAERYFEEGLHTVHDNIVLYTTDTNKIPTTALDLITDQIHIETTEGVTAANNILFQYGLTIKKEINLQPVVNLMGQFLKWQTSIAKEDLYEDGVLGSQFKGWNRDEVVPFSIRFLQEGGFETALFPFISRTPTPQDPNNDTHSYDFEQVVTNGQAKTLENDEDNKDIISILSNKTSCGSTDRIYRWQYYNTATKDSGYCGGGDETIPIQIVSEEVTRICELPIPIEIPASTISIPLTTTFSTFENYIEDNIAECEIGGDPSILTGTNPVVNLCTYLSDTYQSILCDEETVMGDLVYDESDPLIPECIIKVDEIIGEKSTKIPKIFPEQYNIMVAPKNCTLYKIDYQNSGVPLQDPTNPLGYVYDTTDDNIVVPVYKRDSDFQNEDCRYPKEILLNSNTLQNNREAVFNNYLVSTTSNDLLSNINTTPFGTTFKSKLHKNAIWFKGATEAYTEFIIDISKQKDADGDDFVNIGDNTKVRFSLFKKCDTNNTAIFSQLVDLSKGGIYYLKKVAGQLEITDSTGIVYPTAPGSWFSSGEYYVAIDTPLVKVPIDVNPTGIKYGIFVYGGELTYTQPNVSSEDRYLLSPTDGGFTVTKRYPEFDRVDIVWESIRLKKVCTYKAICDFEQPIAQSCKVYPFEKGKFAYWESTEGYPDNTELYDSSKLKISTDRIDTLPVEVKREFEEVFTNGEFNGNYTFKSEPWEGEVKKVADFTCRKIRHFKFPDNNLAPFMYDKQQAKFGHTIIFPIGITIDENIINTFLDIAVDNNLISLEERRKITGYEIFSGSVDLDRTVVASGLLYDMRKYREDENINKDVLYSNYPYNTYSADKLNRPFTNAANPETDETRTYLGDNSDLMGTRFGESNRHYTFHSPETEYAQAGLPSEISIQSYMFGNSRGFADQVKEHPKWVILSEKAYTLANILAVLEVTAEAVISTAQIMASGSGSYAMSFFGGPAGGGYGQNIAGGIIATTATVLSAILETTTAIIYKYGRYRYQWLKIFRDLGTPHNFAYYYFSDGHYNYVNQANPLSSGTGRWSDEGDKLRALNIAKYMGDGRYTITNESTGEKLNVNNIDREHSVFLSFGNNPIKYPPTYANFDKNSNDSSLTYLGENNIQTSGRSPEIIRNIASPYAALKNYNPTQYGTINSVKWLSTGHRGDLKNPQNSCLSIFGGDTFITRHTLKRKLSLFLVTAMKQADMTPYNYYFYNNIGRRPQFYVSYEENKDFDGGGKDFPEIRSDYVMDTTVSRGNYFTPPSKFYLYYYGVPSFLTETRKNTAYRYAGKSLKDNFYPLVGDLGEWTQEKTVSIREPNVYKYNNTYSKSVFHYLRHRVIPDTYKKAFAEKAQDKPNGIIASLPDSNETALADSWLIYRPQDTFEFPTNYGKLRDIIDVESQAILTRFTDTSILYNKVDSKIDVGTEVTAITMGGKAFFQRLSTSFVNSKLGYGGTQNFAQVSCEAGHFWADAKRGQVLMLAPNSGAIQEISTSAGSKASGMRNWFKEHLPFKILKTIPNADIDNPYNGVGLTMGWDSRHRRVFLTKKDYIPGPCVEFIEGKGFVYNETACCDPQTTTNCPTGYTYNISTSMCEKLIRIPAVCPTLEIIATNDTGVPVPSTLGGTALANVLVNDTLDGVQIVSTEVNTTLVSSTHPGVTLSGNSVVVAPGTPNGAYVLTYRICEIENTSNCDTANVNVIVINAVIRAIDDTGTPLSSISGGVSLANVLANDTLNGAPIMASQVITGFVSSTNPGVTLFGNSVKVAPGTPSGTYTLTYKICESANTLNCDTAVVTVVVNSAPLIATNDTGVPVIGVSGGTAVTNILVNDTLNGVAVTAPQVTTSLVSSTNTGVTLSGNSVVVAPGTPSGTYTLTYQICEVINPSNCDTAVVTVVVNSTPIIANDNTGINITTTIGGTAFTDVLANDTLNGVAVIPANVTISFISSTNAGITLSGANVVVATGVPIGAHSLTYKVCENLNPLNCDTAIVNFEVVEEVCTLAIGDSHEGGIIFYLDNTGCHGLVVTEEDLVTAGVPTLPGYTNVTTFSPGSLGSLSLPTTFGSGLANTNLLFSTFAHTTTAYSLDYAAQLCVDYAGGGFTDWYLPSRDELYKVWQNMSVCGDFAADGDTRRSQYWTSSRVPGSGLAYSMFFYSYGTAVAGNAYPKAPDGQNGNGSRVRAIRNF